MSKNFGVFSFYKSKVMKFLAILTCLHICTANVRADVLLC